MQDCGRTFSVESSATVANMGRAGCMAIADSRRAWPVISSTTCLADREKTCA